MNTILLIGGAAAAFFLLSGRPLGMSAPTAQSPGTNAILPGFTFNGLPVDRAVYRPGSPEAREQTRADVAAQVEADRRRIIAEQARRERDRAARNEAARQRGLANATDVNTRSLDNLQATQWSSITTRQGKINAAIAQLTAEHPTGAGPSPAMLAYLNNHVVADITVANLFRNAYAIGVREGHWRERGNLLQHAQDLGFNTNADYYAWWRAGRPSLSTWNYAE